MKLLKEDTDMNIFSFANDYLYDLGLYLGWQIVHSIQDKFSQFFGFDSKPIAVGTTFSWEDIEADELSIVCSFKSRKVGFDNMDIIMNDLLRFLKGNIRNMSVAVAIGDPTGEFNCMFDIEHTNLDNYDAIKDHFIAVANGKEYSDISEPLVRIILKLNGNPFFA